MTYKVDCAVVALIVAGFASGAARATDDSAKGAARDLANEAKRNFDAGNYEEAGHGFQRAYEIARVPMLAVWIARTLAKRGQLVAASEMYRQATLLTPNDLWVGGAQQQAQADAARELGVLQPRIPRLCIRIDGAAANDVELTMDDLAIATVLFGVDLPVDPGRRRVVGRQGAQTVARAIDLAEGEHKEAVLRFNAATATAAHAHQPPAIVTTNLESARPELPAEQPHDGLSVVSTPTLTEAQPIPPIGQTRRRWGWSAVGIGSVGLLTGLVTGIDVLAGSNLRSNCPSQACDPAKVGSSSVNRYNLMRDLSVAGFIVGGVGTAVGVTLLSWTPKQEREAPMALWLGLSSAGVHGAF
jgi:hypothetical protein